MCWLGVLGWYWLDFIVQFSGNLCFGDLPCLGFVVFGLSGCFEIDCFDIAFGFGFGGLLCLFTLIGVLICDY